MPRLKRERIKAMIRGRQTEAARGVIETWNIMAGKQPHLETLQRFTAGSVRARRLENRLNDPKFIERFAEVCEIIANNTYLRGELERRDPSIRTPFAADFDWLLRNGHFWTRILAGDYRRFDVPTPDAETGGRESGGRADRSEGERE